MTRADRVIGGVSVAKQMNGRRMRRWSSMVFALTLFAFVGISWFVGGALIAPANHPVGPPPDGLPVESLTIPSASGSSLAAWYIPADGATATVLLLHPIRGDRRSMLGRARLLQDAGYATLLVDLQAHGESPGEYITAGYRERLDVVAAIDFIRSRAPDHRIGVVGCSLGGAATLLASPLDVHALVLESVYPTITEAVHNRVAMRLGALHHILSPALLVQLNPRLGVSPSQLRPIEKIADAGCPVLIASGDRDLRTTLAEAKRLYDAAHEPKKLVIFSGAAHADLLAYNPVQYRDEVVGFLDTHLGWNPP